MNVKTTNFLTKSCNTHHSTISQGFSGLPVDILQYLQKCNIISADENLFDMIERIRQEIIRIEQKKFNSPKSDVLSFSSCIASLILRRQFIPQTTVLLNIGKHTIRPLTACTVPPIDWSSGIHEIIRIAQSYHQEGMGTGYNLDHVAKPVQLLRRLNDSAIEEYNSDNLERPVGNMAILSIDHPAIQEFIEAKAEDINHIDWKFNLSVNISEKFMQLSIQDKPFRLHNGTIVRAKDLIQNIAEMASLTGDPGIIFLDRLNLRNPVRHLGEYVSVSPCAEVGLIPGETCQFGYINVGAFVTNQKIDYESLKSVIHHAIRFLDDALEISIHAIHNARSNIIMNQKRKIGLGICGFADLLVQLNIPYGSQPAVKTAENLMSFINFESKIASIQLANTRGPFPAFHNPLTAYHDNYITSLFGQRDTQTVKRSDWRNLDNLIASNGIRNSSTTALPPTGRSASIIGASPQIEPYFTLKLGTKVGESSIVNSIILKSLNNQNIPLIKIQRLLNRIHQKGTLQEIDGLPEHLYPLFPIALELSIDNHLETVAAFQTFTDEAVSKTVNLPRNTEPKEIIHVFERSFELGLIGVTVYVDGSRKNQPNKL